MKYIISLILVVPFWNILLAQDNIYIHSGASVKMHTGATMGIFGNLENEASLDFSAFGDIFFFGQSWTNAATSTLGIGTGGTAFFEQPNPLYGTSIQQDLDGGGNLVIFPNIQITNADHLQLVNTNTKIRSSLIFDQGCFILNDQNLTVGDGNSGTISQYDENRFVVTNSAPATSSGFLIREQLGATATEFPVGIAIGDYTPARLSNTGTPDDFSVRVFPDVFSEAINGANKNNVSVARTWNIEEAIPSGSNVELDLQHNLVTEGANYNPNNNYVARYIGVSPNTVVAYTESSWDFVGTPNCANNLSPADITTGSAIAGAARNVRAGLDNFSDYQYYAPALCLRGVLPIELKSIHINELSDCTFQLVWSTAHEENVAHFEIEASSNTENFEMIGKVEAQNQASTYNFHIDKTKEETYYLRLKIVDLDGSITYGSILAYSSSKDCQKENYIGYSIFPNPISQSNQLNVRVKQLSEFPVNGQFVFTDILGRTILRIPLSITPNQELYTLDINTLSVGTYFIRYLVEGKGTLPLRRIIIKD